MSFYFWLGENLLFFLLWQKKQSAMVIIIFFRRERDKGVLYGAIHIDTVPPLKAFFLVQDFAFWAIYFDWDVVRL